MSASETTRPGRAPQIQGTASFSKFVDVLQTIAENPGKLDMGTLAKALPYPRGTLHRIVMALISEDFVREDHGVFQLGPRLIYLASKSWENSDLRSVAHDHLAALRDATGETIHLAVPSGNAMVYIDKLESPRAVRMMSRIGTRVEIYATSVGKAYLAALPEERVREIAQTLDMRPRTRNTITDPSAFLAEVQRTRERGYSYDNEENEADIRCFGGVIFDRSGDPVGAISLSIPIYRFDEERAAKYIVGVKETVAAISQSLATVI